MTQIRMAFGLTQSVFYDALVSDRIRPRGIDVTYIFGTADEIFYRMLNGEPFDVAEMSLAAYVMQLARGGTDLVAIPVFPVRAFRHNSVYVRTGSPLTELSDLRGCKVGTPEFQMTANVWLRHALEHDYAIGPGDIDWFVGGLDRPGRKDRIELGQGVRAAVERIASSDTLSDLLIEGELDALVSAGAPERFAQARGIRRLCADTRALDIEYFRKWGIFPIMHVITLRRDVHDRFPWAAREIVQSFNSAKDACQKLQRGGGFHGGLAWLGDVVELERRVLGDSAWAYGLEANRAVLATFIDACQEQGLIERPVAVDDLFDGWSDESRSF